MSKLLKALMIGLAGLLFGAHSARADSAELVFSGVVTKLGTSSLGGAEASSLYSLGEVVTGRLVYDPNVPRLEHPFTDMAFYYDYSPSSGLELMSKAGVLSSINHGYIGMTVVDRTDSSSSPDSLHVNEYGAFHASGLPGSPYIYAVDLGLVFASPLTKLDFPAPLSGSMFSSGYFSARFVDGSYIGVTLDFADPAPVPEPQQLWMLLLGLIGVLNVVSRSSSDARSQQT